MVGIQKLLHNVLTLHELVHIAGHPYSSADNDVSESQPVLM